MRCKEKKGFSGKVGLLEVISCVVMVGEEMMMMMMVVVG